jgi:hypothetical protein
MMTGEALTIRETKPLICRQNFQSAAYSADCDAAADRERARRAVRLEAPAAR